MSQILVSTGALIGRPNGRNYRLLSRYVPELQSDGIEFMMYSTWYGEERELTEYLKKEHFPIPVMHCQKTVGESLTGLVSVWDGEAFRDRFLTEEEDREAFSLGCKNFETNLKIASEIGAKTMVLHLWNGPASDKNIEKNLERFGTFLSLSGKYGIDLLVENVICNQKDPMTHIRRLRELYPEVRFVYDTKMAAFHNQTELLFEPEWDWLLKEKHIRHFHINDYGGGYMDWGNLKVLPIGAGRIDFPGFFRKLKGYSYEGAYTLEATGFDKTGAVDMDMLNRNVRSLRKLLEG